MQKILIAPCLSLLLISCVSQGVKIDQSKLSQLHKGETTYSEVVHEWGKPTQVTMLDNGNKLAMYVYVSAQARPETFIPVVGAFVGGADSENSTVMLTFDSNEVLQSYNSSQGSTGTGTGFEAISEPRNFDQPNIVK